MQRTKGLSSTTMRSIPCLIAMLSLLVFANLSSSTCKAQDVAVDESQSHLHSPGHKEQQFINKRRSKTLNNRYRMSMIHSLASRDYDDEDDDPTLSVGRAGTFIASKKSKKHDKSKDKLRKESHSDSNSKYYSKDFKAIKLHEKQTTTHGTTPTLSPIFFSTLPPRDPTPTLPPALRPTTNTTTNSSITTPDSNTTSAPSFSSPTSYTSSPVFHNYSADETIISTSSSKSKSTMSISKGMKQKMSGDKKSTKTAKKMAKSMMVSSKSVRVSETHEPTFYPTTIVTYEPTFSNLTSEPAINDTSTNSSSFDNATTPTPTTSVTSGNQTTSAISTTASPNIIGTNISAPLSASPASTTIPGSLPVNSVNPLANATTTSTPILATTAIPTNSATTTAPATIVGAATTVPNAGTTTPGTTTTTPAIAAAATTTVPNTGTVTPATVAAATTSTTTTPATPAAAATTVPNTGTAIPATAFSANRKFTGNESSTSSPSLPLPPPPPPPPPPQTQSAATNSSSSSWTMVGTPLEGVKPDEQFGYRVQLSENAQFLAVSSLHSPFVHLYERDTNTKSWIEVDLSDIFMATDDGGGWVTLSGDASTLAIAGGNVPKGQVRVYSRVKDQDGVLAWVQRGNVITSNPDDGNKNDDATEFPSNFGHQVVLSHDGTTIAVGDSEFSNYTGWAQVYDYNAANTLWEPVGPAFEGFTPGEHLGSSLDLSRDGRTFAVCATEFSYMDGPGYCHVYRRTTTNNNNVWEELGLEILGQEDLDSFGRSVSLSADGNTLAITADGHDQAGTMIDAGRAYVFRYDETLNMWPQVGQMINGKHENQRLGHSIDLSADGSMFIVGAWAQGFELKGYAEVYKLQTSSGDNGEKWVLLGDALTNGNEYDNFGNSVSISSSSKGITVAVGAYNFGSQENENNGQVTVYELQ